MKVFEFRRTQTVPVTIDEAWAFFSSPKNLKRITPEYMGFDILSDLGEQKMYPGMMIRYRVKPVFNIPMEWLTEITQVKEPYFFIDEQRSGPYALWHHQHHFNELDGQTHMTDIIHYALPLGPIGKIANQWMVRSKIEEIFEFRKKKIAEIFTPSNSERIGDRKEILSV